MNAPPASTSAFTGGAPATQPGAAAPWANSMLQISATASPPTSESVPGSSAGGGPATTSTAQPTPVITVNTPAAGFWTATVPLIAALLAATALILVNSWVIRSSDKRAVDDRRAADDRAAVDRWWTRWIWLIEDDKKDPVDQLLDPTVRGAVLHSMSEVAQTWDDEPLRALSRKYTEEQTDQVVLALQAMAARTHPDGPVSTSSPPPQEGSVSS